MKSLFQAALLTMAVGCGGGDSDAEDGADTDEELAYGECPVGEIWAEPGCGVDAEGGPEPACYVACSTGCPDGTVCKTVWLNPCVCPEGETCCGACGGEGEICMDDGTR